MEGNITEQYLRALADAYSQYFYRYDEAPLMIINTEHLNPIDSEEDFQTLLRQLADLKGRRVFFSQN